MNKLILGIYLYRIFSRAVLLFTVFINLLFDSRLFHNTIKNINGVFMALQHFYSLYTKRSVLKFVT